MTSEPVARIRVSSWKRGHWGLCSRYETTWSIGSPGIWRADHSSCFRPEVLDVQISKRQSSGTQGHVTSLTRPEEEATTDQMEVLPTCGIHGTPTWTSVHVIHEERGRAKGNVLVPATARFLKRCSRQPPIHSKSFHGRNSCQTPHHYNNIVFPPPSQWLASLAKLPMRARRRLRLSQNEHSPLQASW